MATADPEALGLLGSSGPPHKSGDGRFWQDDEFDAAVSPPKGSGLEDRLRRLVSSLRRGMVLIALLLVVLATTLLVIISSRGSSGLSTSSDGSTSAGDDHVRGQSTSDYSDSSGSSYSSAEAESQAIWSEAVSFTSTSKGDIEFTLARLGYDPLPYFSDSRSDILKYQHLADYYGIIEPGQTMHLEVYNDDDVTTNKFRYTVCSPDGGECQHGVRYDPDPGLASTINFDCAPYDEYVINVTEYVGDTAEEVRSTTGYLLCQYVRREIRTLTTTDLSATLDAMHTLWAVSDEEGQDTYGEDYNSASYLLKSHHFNAAWPDGDHIHEGNGFMTQHIKMTNIFEKSMQAVDSRVSLPYWDFTKDNVEGKTPVDSTIFTSSGFGSMTAATDMLIGFSSEDDLIVDGAIPDGRWAYLTADMNEDYDDLRSGYGYMRAPWNMNPSPYVSRFAYDYQIGISLPSCKTHYEILQYDSMMDFFVDIEDSPHATTHSLTGGIYGCNLMRPLLEAGYILDEDNMKTICSKWVFYMKEFYRSKLIVPYDSCEVSKNVQSSTCGFSCDEDSVSYLKLDIAAKITSNTGPLTETGWEAWKDFVCTGDGANIFSGDHLESASPADPSFWVIHPTLDRLLQAKFMAGGFSDETWATDAKDDYVCNKAECYEDGYSDRDYYSACCYGHYENDQMLDFTSGNRSMHIGWTNGRVVKATDPRSEDYEMDYVYDSFEWSHCLTGSFNLDFDALLEDLSAAKGPTAEPSQKPTEAPLEVPTRKPSFHPTVTGYTHKPTHSPDYIRPTNHPTVTGYTHKPTHAPDYIRPTNHPTVTGYTHRPTHEPSSKPSSAFPTAVPSYAAPTSDPSETPTPKPTKKPTKHSNDDDDDDDDDDDTGKSSTSLDMKGWDFTSKPTKKPTKSPSKHGKTR